ncbi:hypothetical protein Sango_2392200 [Sesamum angolense]|uniref:Reverse transcriptase domain-containing protein n=1 Tax=Sesamum angolense TaxID=2727404 RepID=A0AAE1W6X2_9LAMI|nr:hypothetical protein Sango_2392200 [Sesamum angolense]
MLGGKQFGSLKPERGLRQWDPLSPYLFLLYTESFSSLLQNVEREGHLRGVAVCRGAPSITHLLFADDTLIFYQASPQSSHTIKGVLETYRRASGQEINFSKSSVAFSRNTNEELCLSVVSDLTIRRENKMELYLGLPRESLAQKGIYFLHFGIGFGIGSQGGMRNSFLRRAKKFSSNRFSKQSPRMRWVASNSLYRCYRKFRA